MFAFKDYFLNYSNDVIEEGVHDPAKLKAIFLAGGPGSGKSHVVNHVRGDLGFKMVNSDDILEHKMKQHGLSMKMPPEEESKRDSVRLRAKELTQKRQGGYQHGRLGMIIDGTGKDFDEIKRKSEHLRSLGYDTHMLHINTTLDVAKKRNAMRPRSVPDHIVTHGWNQVQKNIPKFEEHFGKNFRSVDNSNEGTDPEAINKLHKHIRKIASSEVQNPVGKKWIESGGKG